MPYTPEQIAARFQHFQIGDLIRAVQAHYPEAYAFTRQFEGGYVDDPDDPGGCTNMGITIGTLRAWRDDPDITCADVQALAEPEVGLIYFSNYWEPVWGNQLPIGVNTQVWDWGVNSGPSRSVRELQELVGSTPDGVMGPNTVAAVDMYVETNGIETVLQLYSARRQDFYESLSTFDKYGNGWTRRNDECLALSLQLASEGPAPAPSFNVEDRVAALEEWARSFKG